MSRLLLARTFLLAQVGDVVVFDNPNQSGFGERWRLTKMLVSRVSVGEDYSAVGRGEDCTFHKVDNPAVVEERPCILIPVEWSVENFRNHQRQSFAEARDARLLFNLGEQVIKKPGPLDTAFGQRWVVHESSKVITIPETGQPFRPVHTYRLRAVDYHSPVGEITVSEEEIRRPAPAELRKLPDAPPPLLREGPTVEPQQETAEGKVPV
jgi:hypothetical protein